MYTAELNTNELRTEFPGLELLAQEHQPEDVDAWEQADGTTIIIADQRTPLLRFRSRNNEHDVVLSLKVHMDQKCEENSLYVVYDVADVCKTEDFYDVHRGVNLLDAFQMIKCGWCDFASDRALA